MVRLGSLATAALNAEMQAVEMHAQRRLAGTYYGGLNWVIMFVLCGLVFIYCCVYQVRPRWLRLYRHCFAKRLTRVLDEIDDFETMFEESRRVQQVDEETGELYWVDDRMQSEEMASSEEAAAAGGEGGGEESKEEVKTGEEIQLLDANGDPTASPVPSKRRKKPKALSPKKLMQLKQQLHRCCCPRHCHCQHQHQHRHHRRVEP
jgi:hypothetical protein